MVAFEIIETKVLRSAGMGIAEKHGVPNKHVGELTNS